MAKSSKSRGEHIMTVWAMSLYTRATGTSFAKVSCLSVTMMSLPDLAGFVKFLIKLIVLFVIQLNFFCPFNY